MDVYSRRFCKDYMNTVDCYIGISLTYDLLCSNSIIAFSYYWGSEISDSLFDVKGI